MGAWKVPDHRGGLRAGWLPDRISRSRRSALEWVSRAPEIDAAITAAGAKVSFVVFDVWTHAQDVRPAAGLQCIRDEEQVAVLAAAALRSSRPAGKATEFPRRSTGCISSTSHRSTSSSRNPFQADQATSFGLPGVVVGFRCDVRPSPHPYSALVAMEVGDVGRRVSGTVRHPFRTMLE